MSNSPALMEGGEPFTLEVCDRCGMENAKGTAFLRGPKRLFNCDDCGKNSFIGYLEDAHKQQVQGKTAHEHATEQRDRFWRENQTKQMDEYERLKHEPNSNAESVFNIDYARRRI